MRGLKLVVVIVIFGTVHCIDNELSTQAVEITQLDDEWMEPTTINPLIPLLSPLVTTTTQESITLKQKIEPTTTTPKPILQNSSDKKSSTTPPTTSSSTENSAIDSSVAEQINSLLEQNVDSDGVVSNIIATKQLLSDQQTLKTSTGNQMKTSTTNLLAGLRKFSTLSTISANNLCSPETYAKLNDMDNLTQGQARHVQIRSSQDQRRIDKIVNYYCTEYAQVCLDKLIQSHKKVLTQLGGRMAIQFIDDIVVNVVSADKIATKSSSENTSEDYTVNNKTETSSKRPLVYKHIYENLILNSFELLEFSEVASRAVKSIRKASTPNNDSDLNYLNPFYVEANSNLTMEQQTERRRTKVTSLVQKYLLKPCEKFIKTFGSNLFEMANFGAQFYRDFKTKTVNYEFYYDWACYRVCESLVKDYKQLVEVMLETVVLSDR